MTRGWHSRGTAQTPHRFSLRDDRSDTGGKWHYNGLEVCAALPRASPAALQCLLLQAGLFSAVKATRLIQAPQEVGKW